MSQQTPAYVSSTGHLTNQPLTKRLYDAVSGYATIGYLFFETLVAPLINPNGQTTTSQQTRSASSPRGEGGPGTRGGGSGGGGGGGSNPPRGGGFMTMGDLRGGQTVDGCRATCG
ncbi:uncharacterized protein EHS24_009657 [Apiotrichum porosum]|uniref:Uncharacterized protein n=1 Tax=Apiotrichum porosum TaxID=105984 RepID=A0A427XM95_9TREE|nr:uncharacterized protein EHS24_009657 [Apiotrichum porosum]RSH79986.1 hypothetical protein EHS24_009657 [Apiotrichum porosum]